MKADPPLIGLHDDTVEDVFPRDPRAEGMLGAFGELFRMGTGLQEKPVEALILFGQSRLVFMIARRMSISVPEMDTSDRSSSETIPCLPSHGLGIFTGDFPERETEGPCEDGVQ